MLLMELSQNPGLRKELLSRVFTWVWTSAAERWRAKKNLIAPEVLSFWLSGIAEVQVPPSSPFHSVWVNPRPAGCDCLSELNCTRVSSPIARVTCSGPSVIPPQCFTFSSDGRDLVGHFLLDTLRALKGLTIKRKTTGEEKKQIIYVHVYTYNFKGIYLRE